MCCGHYLDAAYMLLEHFAVHRPCAGRLYDHRDDLEVLNLISVGMRFGIVYVHNGCKRLTN